MADETQNIEVPEKFKAIVEAVEKMSVIDLNELVKALEEKFVFTVELTDTGAQKIAVIKVVKEALAMGLKEAKDLVDAAPKVLKEGVKKAEAEELKKKIEGAGGKVTLK